MGRNIRYLHGVDPQSVKAAPPTAAAKENSEPHKPTPFIPKAAECLLKQGIRVFRVLLEAFVLKSDDTLYQMSKNASVDQDQHAYFSALRCLRLNKVLLTQRFEKGYEQAFYQFFSAPLPGDALSSANLSIVDKEAMEIDLAGELMAKRAKQRCEVEVLNLQARLESICSDGCHGKTMPFDPLLITLMFKDLLQTFELDTKSKLVLLKEFERTVLKYLPELIASINQQLIKMGILPALDMRPNQNVGHRVRANAPTIDALSAASTSPSSPSMGAQHHSGFVDTNRAGQSGYAAPSMQYAEMLHQNFEQWLAGQVHENGLMPNNSAMMGPMAGAAGQALSQGDFSGLKLQNSGDGVRLDTMQLTPVLTNLQQQILQNQAQLTPTFMEEAIHQREGLMRYVHQHLQRSYQQGYQLDHREYNILGLLTKVFSQVLEQEALPKLVRYALWNLQIPYLKVALQDTHFFIDANHPARQLLTLLADSALQIDLTQTCNDPLLDQIELIAQRVLQEFDQDMSLFVTLIAEFRGFLALHKRRINLLQQRLIAAEEGKARREAAEQAVDDCIQRLLTEEVPESVCAFAKQWWWKVLFYLYLKEGVGSDDWRRAHQCMQNLITTVLPKSSSMDVEIAKQGMAELVQQLRAGLLWVGCDDAEIKQLIKALRLFHSVGVIRKPMATTEAASVSAESLPAAIVVVPTESSTGASSVKAAKTESVAIKTAATKNTPIESPAILAGEWIEYTKKADEVIRCQLVMHLPSCDKMIFINRIGMKVLECKGHEFREKLAKGECRKLPQSALFDQALRQVIELMQVDQSKSWKFA